MIIEKREKTILISSFGSNELTDSIQLLLGIKKCEAILSHFKNGETRVEITTSIRNKNIIIVAQIRKGYINDDFLGLTMILDACQRSSVDKINLVLPYFPYSRSDKKDKSRISIGAANIANILKIYKIDNIISLDLHSGQLQGLFDKGFHNLYMINHMSEFISQTLFLSDDVNEDDVNEDDVNKDFNKDVNKDVKSNYVLVSPDIGGINRIEAYSKKLNMEYIVLHKTRDHQVPGTIINCIAFGTISKYVGKTAIIVDDIMDSGGTMMAAVNKLIENGIKDIIIVITHGIFSGDALLLIDSCSYIKKVYTSNSLPQTENKLLCDKISVVNAAGLISKALITLDNEGSLSRLFFQ